METVTGIGFKNPERRWRVASSIALVVQLTAMLEAWWVAFKSLEVRTNPGCSTPIYQLKFFLFFSFFFFFLTVKKPQNEKKVKKRSSEVSPLIFRYWIVSTTHHVRLSYKPISFNKKTWRRWWFQFLQYLQLVLRYGNGFKMPSP